jgi:hypothetical protein
MRSAVLALACAALLAPAAAGAHSRGTSYSDWRIAGNGAEVRVRVSQLELTRLQLDPATTADYAARAAEVLRDNLQLWTASGPCAAAPASAAAGADGWVTAQWTVACSSAGPLTLRTQLFLSVAPSHLHFARVQFGNGAVFERVLTYAEPSFTLEAPPLSTSFGHYLRLGIGHILSGWDHMAFVLALILLAASVREVALVATGFTVAHSLTLAAAVLGWADPQSAAIESLIGFSIAVVAAENLWLAMGRERWVPATFVLALLALALLGATRLPGTVLLGLALFTASYFALARTSARPARLRIAVAFVFGLVHGFGFAGALTPLALPPDRLAVGLLGFNSGVEAGQLLVIAAVWPALKLMERLPSARRWAGDLASAAICALGAFWFVTRAFGGIA